MQQHRPRWQNGAAARVIDWRAIGKLVERVGFHQFKSPSASAAWKWTIFFR